jgi:hypothetical protein
MVQSLSKIFFQKNKIYALHEREFEHVLQSEI